MMHLNGYAIQRETKYVGTMHAANKYREWQTSCGFVFLMDRVSRIVSRNFRISPEILQSLSD